MAPHTLLSCFATAVKATVAMIPSIALQAVHADPPAPAAVEIAVDVAQAGRPAARWLTAACIEDVNHEIYGGLYSQMIFGESFQEPARKDGTAGLSGMWSMRISEGARALTEIEHDRPFVGAQSQRLALDNPGEASISNAGLNRWGLSFAAQKDYEGVVWIRSKNQCDVFAQLSIDDKQIAAEQKLALAGDDAWHRYAFRLTPDTSTDHSGRFCIALKSPASVVIGYASLQPGEWGRFKGLPVRKDIADAMLAQGITALRYGGSMVNESTYRWKQMLGPRDRREPYKGHWYNCSTNGWGIIDFLDFAQAGGIEAIPDFNMDESPQDMADFVEYALGAPESEWGKRRAADGHAAPYPLHAIELGNEERVDDHYYERFAKIAAAIWSKHPQLTLVVGDFVYNDPITDPMKVSGADSHITTLDAHRKIMALARQYGAEVWFDVHINTNEPAQARSFLAALKTYVDAIDSLAGGAKHHVVVFELNAGNHAQKRALANAIAIGAIQRDGRLPLVASANGLQPDGQNDNDWDQGLLFFNPSKVWLQPPGYVTQMIASSHQPITLAAQISGDDSSKIDVTASRSEDGKTLVLSLVNPTEKPITARLRLNRFNPSKTAALRVEISGNPEGVNTAQSQQIVPHETSWPHHLSEGSASCELPGNSFTVLRFE